MHMDRKTITKEFPWTLTLQKHVVNSLASICCDSVIMIKKGKNSKKKKKAGLREHLASEQNFLGFCQLELRTKLKSLQKHEATI